MLSSAEQVIHCNLAADNAAVFIRLYSIRCDHCDLNGFLCFCDCSEYLSPGTQALVITFI